MLLESLLKIDSIQLVAICDIWEYARTYGERYLKKLGVEVRAYENFEDLLAKEKDLQAVVVATPDFWHAPITNACLKAGLHVYCEKMMSNTIEGARSMVQTMRETGKLLQIGHQRRSNPRYLFALNRLVRDAKICGRLTAAQAQWNRAVTEDFGWPKHSRHAAGATGQIWLTRTCTSSATGAGSKISAAGRCPIWARTRLTFSTGGSACKPKSVMASGGLDYYKNHEWFDNAMVIYEYPLPDGVARAFYQVQTTTSAGGGYFEYFMGDEGSIKMSENPDAVRDLPRSPRAVVGRTHPEKLPPRQSRARGRADAAKVDVRETAQLAEYEIPVSFNKPPHLPHLENFFNAINGTGEIELSRRRGVRQRIRHPQGERSRHREEN